MGRKTSVDVTLVESVRAVEIRTGQMVSVFLDGTQLQVVAPDRTSGGGVSVTDLPLDEVVLAGPVAGRLAGHRGAWTITRAVRIDDPHWGECAPAWSWLLAPDDGKESRRSAERFLDALRGALPKERWAKSIKLSKAARTGVGEAATELLELARRRDPAFAAACAEVHEERARRNAGLGEQAERVLLESLSWRTSVQRPAATTG